MYSYPVNQEEFESLTTSEQACHEYLETIRWPNGFICPNCGSKKAWKIVSDRWECTGCGRQTSVTAGTIFQDTRHPLTTWFQAIWYITGQKNGASALGLQKLLGLGSYHTAWAWLHRIRRAMVCPGRDLLHGTIQIDETYWGSEQSGKRGRGTEKKTLILVAIEHNETKLGRVRLTKIPDTSGDTLISTITKFVTPGSIIETDGWRGYSKLKDHGFHHVVLKTENEAEPLPHVHLVVSLLKRWLLGTHQGGIQESHLDYYLDEFTFRFNRRSSRSRGLLFQRVLENAVQVQPIREIDLKALK
jgi:transposase-like protein